MYLSDFIDCLCCGFQYGCKLIVILFIYREIFLVVLVLVMTKGGLQQLIWGKIVWLLYGIHKLGRFLFSHLHWSGMFSCHLVSLIKHQYTLYGLIYYIQPM